MSVTLTVRLDDNLHAELLGLARAQGTNLSDLARSSLVKLVELPAERERWVDPSKPTSLTALQRHELALLHRVAATVLKDEEDGAVEGHIRAAEVFENGYVVEYGDALQAIEAELSPQEAELVMDILEMFVRLEYSFDQLSKVEQAALGDRGSHGVRFMGFDGNSRYESRLSKYAQHLIADGRWEQLQVYFDGDHDRGNSHLRAVPIYERMLSEFMPIWKRKVREGTGYTLDAEEIKRVTDAKVHPDHR